MGGALKPPGGGFGFGGGGGGTYSGKVTVGSKPLSSCKSRSVRIPP